LSIASKPAKSQKKRDNKISKHYKQENRKDGEKYILYRRYYYLDGLIFVDSKGYQVLIPFVLSGICGNFVRGLKHDRSTELHSSNNKWNRMDIGSTQEL